MLKIGKALLSLVVAVMIFTSPVLAASMGKDAALAQQSDGVATLIIKLGRVQIERGDEILKAKKGMLLFEGDIIKTGELSRAALILQDGSMVKLNENTDLQLSINAKKKKKNRLRVLLGHLWAKIKKQDSGLEIETPSAVAAIKGTELEIMINGDVTTLVVWDGLVEFFNDLGKKMVGAAQQSSAEKGKEPSDPEKVQLDKQDTWFDSVVDVPETKTLKATIQDKNGKEHKVDLKYQKK